MQLVELGRGSGATFESGVLDLSDTTLGAGSTLLVTASLVTTEDQQLWSGVATINFTSNCVNAGTAEIDASVNAINGRAVSTYRPLAGCVSDYVQASVVLNGVTKVATSAEIQVEQSPVNSLQFEGASPPVIGLRGSAQAGVPEVSILTFLVLDSNGDAVPAGTEVSFEVVAGAGGFTITSGQQSSTNSEGRVSTTVKSGSVPTLGAVRANVVGTEIVGTGSVSVQTGIASQDRFALAVASLNPVSGARLGTTVDVTVRAADRVGNWVPDGTQINFISELGDIQPSCVAESGGCTVTWTSQGPQTIHYDHVRTSRTCFNGSTEEASRKGILETVACGENDRFGRSTITAWAVGEESFTDPNANNLYELGEPWVALPEAFRDDNEDGVWTSAGSYSEFFMDFDENGGYDDVPAVPYFRGLGCSPDAEAAGHCAQLANVRRSSIIVLSTDSVVGYVFSPNANFENARWSAPGGGAPQQWGNTRLRGVTDTGGNYTTDANAEVISLPGDYNGAITVILTDANGNAPPFGSSILVPTNNASNLTVVGPDRCEVVDMIDPLVCTFYLAPLLQNPTTEGTVVITFGSAVPGNDRTKILQVTIP
ncbi:hypothetical protein A167_00086 [Alcanivorax sp. S71-1-4]|nr:hypothetical protein A167_00086 [Alcanivorax sp. S71-1-4]